MKKIYSAMISTMSLLFVVAMLVMGPNVTALAAEVFIGKVPTDKQPIKFGQRIQPLDQLGRPDYTKDYWKVDQRGNLIQKAAGTNRRATGGQNYRIEGEILRPIDSSGRIQHSKSPIKLNDR